MRRTWEQYATFGAIALSQA